MYPRSGFWHQGTSECALVPVLVPGEHPNVPSFRFSLRGTIRQNHPFGNHPFGNPRSEPNHAYQNHPEAHMRKSFRFAASQNGLSNLFLSPLAQWSTKINTLVKNPLLKPSIWVSPGFPVVFGFVPICASCFRDFLRFFSFAQVFAEQRHKSGKPLSADPFFRKIPAPKINSSLPPLNQNTPAP